MLFHEVYGSYYNVVAGILAEAVRGELSGERIRKIIEEKAYLESGITIPNALKKGKWPFLREDYTTPIRHTPTMPLTDLEKQWLKAVCEDPRIRLFDPPVGDLRVSHRSLRGTSLSALTGTPTGTPTRMLFTGSISGWCSLRLKRGGPSGSASAERAHGTIRSISRRRSSTPPRMIK